MGFISERSSQKFLVSSNLQNRGEDRCLTVNMTSKLLRRLNGNKVLSKKNKENRSGGPEAVGPFPLSRTMTTVLPRWEGEIQVSEGINQADMEGRQSRHREEECLEQRP